MVRAVQTRGSIWFQHDYGEDMAARSCEGIVARVVARLSIACAGVKADRMERPKLVDLGCARRHRVSVPVNLHRPCGDHAALQQIYSAAGRITAPTSLRTGVAHGFSNAQH